jgi:hypothetical protein
VVDADDRDTGRYPDGTRDSLAAGAPGPAVVKEDDGDPDPSLLAFVKTALAGVQEG